MYDIVLDQMSKGHVARCNCHRRISAWLLSAQGFKSSPGLHMRAINANWLCKERLRRPAPIGGKELCWGPPLLRLKFNDKMLKVKSIHWMILSNCNFGLTEDAIRHKSQWLQSLDTRLNVQNSVLKAKLRKQAGKTLTASTSSCLPKVTHCKKKQGHRSL